MARPSRRSNPGSISEDSRTFFVTSRTAQSKALLQSERMATLFIDVLRSYVSAGRFKVHEFTIMPNHFHLLITIDKDLTIEKAIQLIKGNSLIVSKKNSDLKEKSGKKAFQKIACMIGKVSCGINVISNPIL